MDDINSSDDDKEPENGMKDLRWNYESKMQQMNNSRKDEHNLNERNGLFESLRWRPRQHAENI